MYNYKFNNIFKILDSKELENFWIQYFIKDKKNRIMDLTEDGKKIGILPHYVVFQKNLQKKKNEIKLPVIKLPNDKSRHTFFEIVIILKGKGVHYIDNKAYPIEKGNIFFISDAKFHKYDNVPKRLEIINICFLPEVLLRDKGDKMIDPKVIMSFSLLEPFFRADNEFNDKLRIKGNQFKYFLNIVFLMIDYFNSEENSIDKRKMLSVYLNLLLKTIINEYKKTIVQSTKDYYLINSVSDYIEKHISERMKWDEFSTALGMSKEYFFIKFKKNTGISCIDYVNEKRIEYACYLIKNTRENISAIAYETGFGSLANFNMVFKKHLGVSPRSYRTGVEQS